MFRSALPVILLVGCSSSSPAPPAQSSSDATVESGAACVFNADCPADSRCECEAGDCSCLRGARGAGKAGVDACTSGNDCVTGLCVEGESGFVCSGPCDQGCGDKLPGCADIPPMGSICVRTPPAKTGATGTFGGKTYAFDAAYFGYDFADGGRVGVSLELQAGSDGTCPPPKKDPQATAVIAGIPAPIVASSLSTAKVTMLGFDPALPIKTTATASNVTIRNVEPCTPADGSACAFELQVDLTFPEGKIAGTTRAIHCASMDAM
ncbi:MAG: hypothetical protein ACXVEF_04855 [Polyangiales bacterium]